MMSKKNRRGPKRRDKLIAWMAYFAGGFNATPGVHSGRLWQFVDTDDDEAVARYMIDMLRDDCKDLKNQPKAKD